MRPISMSVKSNLYSVNMTQYGGAMKSRAESTRRAVRSATAPPKAKVRTKTRPKPNAKPGRGRRPASGGAPYHHGALDTALLEAAERVLERDGLAGLTLRAVAREAGVSHAAPTHHFGDLSGLLSELAAIGYRQFNAVSIAAADAAGPTADDKGLARARAYVAYALAHPGMYSLMFRAERLDMKRPGLDEAADAAFAGLAGSIAAQRHEEIAAEALSLDQAAAIVRAWSLVHGFTMLLLDGRIADILHRLPDGTDPAALLDAMLKTPMIRPSC
jgi:AcrR family transcriptional regulator